MQGKARPRPSSLPPLPPLLATSRRLRKPDKPALEPASSHWAPSPRHSATLRVSGRDLDECRAAFAALDATRSGRLTTEDLEAWQQAPRLEVPPSPLLLDLSSTSPRPLLDLSSTSPRAFLQARQLRVESFLYRRRVRKLARLGGALGPTHTATATYATPLHTLDTPRHPSTPHRQTPPLDIAPPLPLRTLTPNTLPQRR